MESKTLALSCSRPVLLASPQLAVLQTTAPESAIREELQVLFKAQQRYITSFFSTLDYSSLEVFCKACLECSGVIIFTGVGKSGFVARKISQTMVSMGTKAAFLCPTDALHGDIGMIKQGDLLIMLSKSGSTEELVRLAPYAKARGAKLVSVTCRAECILSQQSDIAVHLPLERELCPFELAPVTSTAVQMIFGDTIAVLLMQMKKLTQAQYAMNHPAGRIGKRLTLRVKDLMLAGSALPLVLPTDGVMAVLEELSAKRCGCVLIVDDSEHLLGTFTDGDLRRTLQSRRAQIMDTTVAEVMNRQPRTCCSMCMAFDALQVMERPRKVAFFPVVDEGKVVGLVTMHQLVEAGL